MKIIRYLVVILIWTVILYLSYMFDKRILTFFFITPLMCVGLAYGIFARLVSAFAQRKALSKFKIKIKNDEI